MAQQATQQAWTYQFNSSTEARASSAARAKINSLGRAATLSKTGARRSPRQQPFTLAQRLLAIGIAALLPALAMLYVSAYALSARLEYQRQRLAQATNALREQNLTLRCKIGQSADLTNIAKLAQSAGMRPADPAGESDFLTLPPLQSQTQAKSTAWFSQGSLLVGGLVRQISLSYVPGRAEASVSAPESAQR